MLLDRYLKSPLTSSKSSASNGRLTSVLKTISWRIVGTLDTVCISYFLTGTLELALQIGGVEVVSKMVLYYFHERAWSSKRLRS